VVSRVSSHTNFNLWPVSDLESVAQTYGPRRASVAGETMTIIDAQYESARDQSHPYARIMEVGRTEP